jgi:cytoplasmic FMR1 interacting protein
MDKDLKRSVKHHFRDRATKVDVPRSRIEILLKQRHFQLLGRSIDLNNITAASMNSNLRLNIKKVIERFEASDITSIIVRKIAMFLTYQNVQELEFLLNNIKLTHRLMSEHMQLDSWDSIFSEVNESTSLVSFHGRIILHVPF